STPPGRGQGREQAFDWSRDCRAESEIRYITELCGSDQISDLWLDAAVADHSQFDAGDSGEGGGRGAAESCGRGFAYGGGGGSYLLDDHTTVIAGGVGS